MDWREALRRAWENPGLAVRVAGGFARGAYYRAKFRLLGRRVIIGKRFKVYGKLDIRGPGTVIFGDDCTTIGSYLTPVTPYTHHKDAVIKFGNHVVLTGTRLGCLQRIEVGDWSGLSEARLIDTDFHAVESTSGHRSTTTAPGRPIVIGSNVWVAPAAIILKGVRIGDNVVVGSGTVVVHRVPPNVVVFGNPARVVWRLRGAAPPREQVSSTPREAAQPSLVDGR